MIKGWGGFRPLGCPQGGELVPETQNLGMTLALEFVDKVAEYTIQKMESHVTGAAKRPLKTMLSAHLKTAVEGELCLSRSVECVSGTGMVRMSMMQSPVDSGSVQNAEEDVERDANPAVTAALAEKRMALGLPSKW